MSVSSYRPKYQSIDRGELNQLIDKLIKLRAEIHRVFSAPVTKISNERKYFLLQDLDEEESYYVRELARHKGILTPSAN
ncbi:MAG: hypothetical protein HYS25_13610 [Ignavibacteriales bacterium]|nr:hypothetical protein [Ignavibacteriales bacterium]